MNKVWTASYKICEFIFQQEEGLREQILIAILLAAKAALPPTNTTAIPI